MNYNHGSQESKKGCKEKGCEETGEESSEETGEESEKSTQIIFTTFTKYSPYGEYFVSRTGKVPSF